MAERKAWSAVAGILLVLVPGVLAAEAGGASRTTDEECIQLRLPAPPLVPCALTLTSALAVHGCEGDVCAFTLNVTARGEADLPGYFYVHSLVGTGPSVSSACIGPKPVSDALEPMVFCGRVCEERAVGLSVTCAGAKAGTVVVPLGGCEAVHSVASMDYDDVEGTFAWVEFRVCRGADGALSVKADAVNEYDD